MDWKELEIFEGIDLNDSFVIKWVSTQESIEFILEASIWPSSIYYEQPKPNVHTCYKKAALTFSQCQAITGLKSMQDTNSSKDPDGTLDYGNIDTLFKTATGFNLSGDFGNVQIEGGVLGFTIHA